MGIHVTQIRRRYPTFPKSEGKDFEFEQPTALAHIGEQKYTQQLRTKVDMSMKISQYLKVNALFETSMGTGRMRYWAPGGRSLSK